MADIYNGKVKKDGNDFLLVLPSEITKKASLKEGKKIKIVINGDNAPWILVI